MDFENMTIKEINDKYYGVGDDCHSYFHYVISKELGDKLLKQYPDIFNNGGTRIKPLIDVAYLPDEELTLEELYDDEICDDKWKEEVVDEYAHFEDFKKGEGFE